MATIAPRRRIRPDVAALSAYLLFALLLTLPLWRDLDRAVPDSNDGDHAFFEFVLARAAELVTGDGGNWLFTDRLNVPLGVNMMANTAVLGLGVPLAPVTLVFGPAATFALVLLLGLALTAFGWYWVFARRLTGSRMAAAVGGAFCGFAPGIMTHAQGHPNWTAQFLLPFVVFLLFSDRGRPVRDGLLLGLVMAYQVFINEEALFFTGLGCAVFGLIYALLRWRDLHIRHFAMRVGVALPVAGVLIAYPLWFQFTGSGSYHGVPEFVTSYGNDVASFLAFSTHSLGAGFSPFENIGSNETEENAYLGYPLVIVFVLLAIWLRERPAALAAAVTAVVFGVLSVGRDVITNGIGDVARPGPWEPFAHLPLFDSVVPTRLSLVMIPCIGAMLAVAVDRLTVAERGWQVAGGLAIAAALVPIVPMPVTTKDVAEIPAYITGGGYRAHLADGGSMLVVPGKWADTTGMRWAARTGLDFAQPLGYFLGPDPDSADGRGRFGPTRRPTFALLVAAGQDGRAPALTTFHRTDFAADLEFWRVSAIVLPAELPNRAVVQSTLTSLLGRAPAETGGVTVWDIQR